MTNLTSSTFHVFTGVIEINNSWKLLEFQILMLIKGLVFLLVINLMFFNKLKKVIKRMLVLVCFDRCAGWTDIFMMDRTSSVPQWISNLLSRTNFRLSLISINTEKGSLEICVCCNNWKQKTGFLVYFRGISSFWWVSCSVKTNSEKSCTRKFLRI